MAYYETMYIVHPALEAGRLKDLIQSVEKDLMDLGGKTHVIDVWGKKKLAYPINKEKYGMYILFQFEADGSNNKEFNLGLDHNSNILAYLTTKIDNNTLLSDIESLDKQLGLLQAPEKPETLATDDKVDDSKDSEKTDDESDTNVNQEEN